MLSDTQKTQLPYLWLLFPCPGRLWSGAAASATLLCCISAQGNKLGLQEASSEQAMCGAWWYRAARIQALTWQLGHWSPLEKALTLLDGEQTAFCGLSLSLSLGLKNALLLQNTRDYCSVGGGFGDPLGLGDGERSEFPLRELMSIPVTNPGTLAIARVLRPRDR